MVLFIAEGQQVQQVLLQGSKERCLVYKIHIASHPYNVKEVS